MSSQINVALKIMSSLTVDVEDAINIGMKDHFGVDTPPTYRVVQNTLKLLELFAEKKVLATFFILGEVAETFPSLVKEIVKNGHEIGIHGYKHTKLCETTPKLAFKEIRRAKQIVEDISGQQVFGYRAPYFSINEKSIWIFEILNELGFIYDSSIIDDSYLKDFEVIMKNNIKIIKLSDRNSIFEVSPSSYSIFGNTIPACGGGYLRMFPFSITKIFFREILKNQPVIVYTHPYEIDTDADPPFYREKIEQSSIKTRLSIEKLHYNRKNLLSKLSYLIDNYHFTPLINLIDQEQKFPLNQSSILGFRDKYY